MSSPSSKFDTSPDAYSTSLELNEGLTEPEIEEAIRLAQFAKGGLMVIVSPPRTGKDLFGHVLTWKLKRYFKGLKILKDEKPRELYGNYELFNEQFILEDIAKMQAIAKGEIPMEVSRGSKRDIEKLESVADKWITNSGEVLLKRSALYLQEFWRYLLNRRPHNPMGILVSGIIRQWGHLDCLIIGSAQMLHDLDRFYCQPYINWIVKSRPSETNIDKANPTKFIYTIQKMEYVAMRNGSAIFNPLGRPIPLGIDGAKPREELGGLRFFDLFNSKSAPQMTKMTKGITPL